MRRYLLIIVFFGVFINAQSPCWAGELFKDIANSKDNAFKTFFKIAPKENYDAYKIISGYPKLRMDVPTLKSVVKIRKNSNFANAGMTDDILGNLKYSGNKGVQVSYKNIVNNIDRFITALDKSKMSI